MWEWDVFLSSYFYDNVKNFTINFMIIIAVTARE